MRIWLNQKPSGVVTRAVRMQVMFHINGIPPSGFNNNPGYDYGPAVLRLRQFLGDVVPSGTSKIIQVNS